MEAKRHKPPTGNRKRGVTHKYDWEAAAIIYEQTRISQRALASKLGIPESTVLHRAHIDGWAERRKSFRQRLRDMEREDRLEERLANLASLRDGCREVLDNCLAELNERITRRASLLETEEVEKITSATIRILDAGEKALGFREGDRPPVPVQVTFGWLPSDLTPEQKPKGNKGEGGEDAGAATPDP